MVFKQRIWLLYEGSVFLEHFKYSAEVVQYFFKEAHIFSWRDSFFSRKLSKISSRFGWLASSSPRKYRLKSWQKTSFDQLVMANESCDK